MRTVSIVSLMTLIATLLLPAPAQGKPAQAEGGLRFALGVPMGEFGDNVDNVGFGLGGHIAYAPVPSLALGVGGTFMIYGSKERTIELPLVEDFKLETNNNLVDFYLSLQLRTRLERLTAYLEGRVGGIYLWTESKLKDEDWWDDEEIANKVNYDDIALTYGAGGGLMFMVKDSRDNPDKGLKSVHIDLKALYMIGGEAEYLAEGDIVLGDNDLPLFDPSESETDLLHIELGVVLAF